MSDINDTINRLKERISEGQPVPEILIVDDSVPPTKAVSLLGDGLKGKIKPTGENSQVEQKNEATQSPETISQVPEVVENKVEEPEKNKGGRPPLFTDIEELEKMCAKYLISCLDPPLQKVTKLTVDKDTGKPKREIVWEKKEPEMPTITGLAVYLGTTRKTLMEYEKKPEFSNTIKRAKATIEMAYEKALSRTNGNVTGLIFNLKNNFGWQDKSTVENVKVDALKVLDRIEAAAQRREEENNVIDI